MKLEQLKEQIRGILRERSVNAIQKELGKIIAEMQHHLELYKKSKGTPEEKKHIKHLSDLTKKKKDLQKELDSAVAGLYRNAELKVDESFKPQLGKLYSNPYATAFKPLKEEEVPGEEYSKIKEEEDHEVAMAQSLLDDIIKNATELKGKLGEQEKDIPAWIQDHISQSQNFISQANVGFYENKK